MSGYSGLRVLVEGLRGQKGWQAAWRSPEPKSRYDIILIGAGGHGLATAYYLAKNHGITNIAVIERGWLGGGNTGRNTTIIRSNYYYPQSAALYDFSVKLYEGLSKELNYNVMFSQRGLVTLAHSRHDMEGAARWVGAMQLNGIDTEMLTTSDIAARVPALDVSQSARFPVWGGFMQKRAGTARHDAVAWGYARAASALGVDILQNTEMTGFVRSTAGSVIGVETSRGTIRADKVGMTVAGHSSVLADMAGFRLPVTSYALQAFVSEPLKPVIDTVVLSIATGTYISQSDKGGLVIGGAIDAYPSYAQRGNAPVLRGVIASIAEQYPAFRRLRFLRQWAGIVDTVHDSSPIIGESPVPGLYLNCGWGTGGFKGIPVGGWTLAHHMATGSPHPLAEDFGLRRFQTGALIDEAAASGIAH
ncbi:sarcosine oxidase subunit beta family protein [Novosphingobium sp. AP12]|uniref:sarcosine oxidase subunit beta family protein n=1 Tax=Novosphingobium sp. AP12 TaxID=1144305 RepID=UPI0002720016|nr:sarcosine oxidase subunit beta family protein [Novosphingobium sp. AP12]EJL30854.1 sarcosine oxidase, beta subunit family, heterotetrameric form [Novosphingobium sp. AP12]